MATISWMLGTGGAWDQQANWVGGVAPGSADTAVISTAAAATVVVGAGNFTVGRLITAATDTFSISGGNWTDNGASTLGGAFALSSGSATFNGATRIFGAASITGGTFTVGAGATVTATGGGALAGTITGPGTLTTGGNFTAGSANGTAMFIGQDITWNNGGTASLIGPIYQGIASASETSVINNLAGASFNFASDSASIFAQYIAGTFNNFSTLAKTGGTRSSVFGAILNSTGAIQVSSGTLNLTGGGAISGSESGAGLLR
ncbi:MAG: hypothetical protein NT133_23650, partial [Alphaproteobacteria bacterium]|nr:hypothetical protein [Alphaproteobacteria bacterium]